MIQYYDSTIYCIYRQCHNILEYVVQLLQYPKILPHCVTVNFNITLLLQYNATHHSIIRHNVRANVLTRRTFFSYQVFFRGQWRFLWQQEKKRTTFILLYHLHQHTNIQAFIYNFQKQTPRGVLSKKVFLKISQNSQKTSMPESLSRILFS